MSTGDTRRTPKKSTTPAAAGGTDGADVPDGPVGGVLPVKKATRPANGKATQNRPSSNAAAAKATPAASKATKAAPAKSAARSRGTTEVLDSSVLGRKTATKPGGRPQGGGKKAKRVAPVKVAEKRNWGPIALFSATGLLVVGIIAYGAWPSISGAFEPSWRDRAAGISGIMSYADPASPNYDANSATANHVAGDLNYDQTPPVGGNHNAYWQNCMGDVYPAQIADEHAVHALEHGAVWITYKPDLPQDQIDRLAQRVRDVPYMLMSPHPGLDTPISLQSWGYQLKLDDANDSRIDDFIRALRLNNTQEQGAVCSGGVTEASPTPFDLGNGMS